MPRASDPVGIYNICNGRRQADVVKNLRTIHYMIMLVSIITIQTIRTPDNSQEEKSASKLF